ncbi:hypothetical protein QTP88_012494 [Uroleucon formosanum]
MELILHAGTDQLTSTYLSRFAYTHTHFSIYISFSVFVSVRYGIEAVRLHRSKPLRVLYKSKICLIALIAMSSIKWQQM